MRCGSYDFKQVLLCNALRDSRFKAFAFQRWNFVEPVRSRVCCVAVHVYFYNRERLSKCCVLDSSSVFNGDINTQL
jgi:hypothetical protein